MAEAEDKAKRIVGDIWLLVEPVLRAEGRELIEVEYRRESHGWVLRLFIDAEGGVSVEDCARASRVVSDLLDVHDPIHTPYHLEVSSPGLDRPLRKAAHFARHVGSVVDIRTVEPLGARRNFRGRLTAAGPEGVTLDIEGATFEIPYEAVERARLRYFDSIEGSERA